MVSGIQGTWEGSLTNASVSEDDTRSLATCEQQGMPQNSRNDTIPGTYRCLGPCVARGRS